MKGTIRQRLTIAFISLAVLPLLTIGIGLAIQNVQIQREQAAFVQRQIGQRVAVQVESFITELELGHYLSIFDFSIPWTSAFPTSTLCY